MIRRIQALNYRCFRHVDVSLDRFHVLVGPNASGKSTLFDVVAFISDMIRGGLETAVKNRTRNFQDLAWGRPRVEPGFELAVEMMLPEPVRGQLPKGTTGEGFKAGNGSDTCRSQDYYRRLHRARRADREHGSSP